MLTSKYCTEITDLLLTVSCCYKNKTMLLLTFVTFLSTLFNFPQLLIIKWYHGETTLLFNVTCNQRPKIDR